MITVHGKGNNIKSDNAVDINIDHIVNYEDGVIETDMQVGGLIIVEETREQIADMIYAARCARYEAFARELRNMGVGC